MSRYRIAIVGTGGIAGTHMQALREASDRVKTVAAVDTEPARLNAFCDEHGVPGRYTELGRMLERENPDLVHICTPPASHCALTIRCLEAGAWVLCEKPLCASLAEMDRIEQAEQRTGNYCACVFQFRFGSGARHLKSLIDRQAMGRVLVGQCVTAWYRQQDYFDAGGRGQWKTAVGGCTAIHGIHSIDLLQWFMGDWTEVCAMMDTLDRCIEVEDVSMALVRFASGAMGSIVNSVLSPRHQTSLRLDFQKATVEVNHRYGFTNKDWTFTAAPCATEAELDQWRTLPPEVPASHGAQLAALLDDMDRQQRPQISGIEARRTIELLTAIYKAARTGQPVRRGSISPQDPFYHAMNGQTLTSTHATGH